VPETCRVMINQVKQKLHLVGYLLIQYYKDARYHEHKRFRCVRFEVLILVLLNIQVFGDVILRHWVSSYKYSTFIFRVVQSEKHYITKT